MLWPLKHKTRQDILRVDLTGRGQWSLGVGPQSQKLSDQQIAQDPTGSIH